ncbi:MAG TPA: hypothetical protein VMR50_03990 [Myxococcota bacterium]|nr:hypothetical protein [Myxococcota bacterium]
MGSYSFMSSSRCLASIVCLALFVSVRAAADPVTFEGDTIEGEMTSPYSPLIVTQFAPSAVVGAGPEFTGAVGSLDFFLWNVTVDITGRDLVVSVQGRSDADIGIPWEVVLSDLDFTAPSGPANISGAIFLSGDYCCVTAKTTDHSVTLDFEAAENVSAQYLLTNSSVPEPGALFLGTLGVLLAVLSARQAAMAVRYDLPRSMRSTDLQS